MSENYDDIFERYAAQQEKEAKLSAGRGSQFQRTYEDIYWTALEPNKAKIVRVVGGPPNANIPQDKGSTAKIVTVCWLVGDDGKKFKVVRPDEKEDPGYILNRILNKINAVKWINNPGGKGTKTFPVKEQYPNLWYLVNKNGLTEADKRFKFEKGWNGKQVMIMNVIDRERMEEHRALKHTMLLAKGVTVGDNGTEYYDEGISSYAISPSLNHLFKSYGSWEKYDMAITRTGDINNPFILVNASNSPREVDATVRDFISTTEGLTDEEKSWERYDISKLYRYTTATKIYNRLKNTIGKIDKYLQTNFLKDLEVEVEREKALFAEMYKDEKGDVIPGVSTSITTSIDEDKMAEAVQCEDEPDTETTVETVEEAPAPRTRTRTKNAIPDAAPGSDLPYYSSLSDEFKKHIISATNVKGKWEINWDLSPNDLAACPTCEAASPLEATKCPACGLEF